MKGVCGKETVSKIEILMQKMQVELIDRKVVGPALEKEKATGAILL